MTRPDVDTVPPFYKAYVEYVMDMDLSDALRESGRRVQELVRTIPEQAGTYRYRDGKWTVKEVLCHMMDAERVFAYRALTFSRSDETPLPSFDENSWATLANAHGRSVARLAEEMLRLRQTTIDLYASFSPEMLRREGTASNKKLSVLNLGYIIAGHDIHHLTILRQRYLNV